MLVDTHAHIHFDDYSDRIDDVLAAASQAGVTKILTVGVDGNDSAKAVEFANQHENVWSTVGLHPHHADHGEKALKQIAELATKGRVVAIGECGLDFYRNLSTHQEQERALRFQIELALSLNKPLVFHVREAFDQFFAILDEYPRGSVETPGVQAVRRGSKSSVQAVRRGSKSSVQGVRGLVHCFTSNRANMEEAVRRGLLIALNGIMTFTKDQSQLEAAKHVPLESLVLETDCPFLAPVPKRGQRNEPANLSLTAEFLANLRGESLAELAQATTRNALSLFRLN